MTLSAKLLHGSSALAGRADHVHARLPELPGGAHELVGRRLLPDHAVAAPGRITPSPRRSRATPTSGRTACRRRSRSSRTSRRRQRRQPDRREHRVGPCQLLARGSVVSESRSAPSRDRASSRRPRSRTAAARAGESPRRRPRARGAGRPSTAASVASIRRPEASAPVSPAGTQPERALAEPPRLVLPSERQQGLGQQPLDLDGQIAAVLARERQHGVQVILGRAGGLRARARAWRARAGSG